MEEEVEVGGTVNTFEGFSPESVFIYAFVVFFPLVCDIVVSCDNYKHCILEEKYLL